MGKNASGMYKREKERLLALIDALGIKAESMTLDLVESTAKREAEVCLATHLHEVPAWTPCLRSPYLLLYFFMFLVCT